MAESPERASDTGGSWWSRLGLAGSPQKDSAAFRSPGAAQTLATEQPNAAVKTPLKQIRTHSTSHSTSHPELAFSPTDIPIWEFNKGTPRKPTEVDRKPSEGFSQWTNLFGKNTPS